jgi:hypothetical protein
LQIRRHFRPNLPAAWLASRFKTSAEFAAANLAALGLQTNVIIAAPPPEGMRDRLRFYSFPRVRRLTSAATRNAMAAIKTQPGQVWKA